MISCCAGPIRLPHFGVYIWLVLEHMLDSVRYSDLDILSCSDFCLETLLMFMSYS